MKKISISAIAFLLLFAMLLGTACSAPTGQEHDSSQTTDESSSKETGDENGKHETVEEYTDLSSQFDPQISRDDTEQLTVNSQGNLTATDLSVSFDGQESNYSFASYGIGGNHDSYSCSKCKYEEKNGSIAFHICDDSGSHSGITVNFKTPIKANLVSGIQMTFMTSAEITNTSQIRILSVNESDSSNIVNQSGCPSISGAVNDWKTVDFGMSSTHILSLADNDGYIRGFKFYFRDKDDTDIYIKSFTFTQSIKKLCTVDAVNVNTFSCGDALNAIAAKVAERLTNANIGAEIELRCVDYRQSTSKKHGYMYYKAQITTSDGEQTNFNSLTAVIKKIEGVWLERGEGDFGSECDAKEQWKTNFDKSGIIYLEDNLLKAEEGLANVEYSVIEKDGKVNDPDNVWYAPHALNGLSDEGFSSLYINSALDFAHMLKEGNEYRFLIRGVTRNNNYILHLDIPFEYKPISADAIEQLQGALDVTSKTEYLCSANISDKEAHLRAEIEKTVNNENITVSVKAIESGVNRGSFMATFSYNKNISSDRFPTYSLDNAKKSDFFAYEGRYFTQTFDISYDVEATYDIKLTAPYDGQNNIRIASDETVRYWNTDTDILTSVIYEYSLGEVCDPIPVHLVWEDNGKGAYTIKISEYEDLSNAWIFATSDKKLDVYNLKSGTRYYWRVEREDSVSKTFTFVTEAGYPRYIISDNISNFRDFGGYTTIDGKTVKQGLAFRLSNFDGASNADKIFINECLGIRTELDLRGENSSSPLGSNVQALPISIKWYSGIFENGQSEPLRKAISVFAKEENYPIGYHCAIGRDRTGTVTILLLGLLGVDEDIILKEYIMSKNSVSGSNDGASAKALHDNYKSLINGLKRYGKKDDTLQVRIETYLLSIGITAEEIASIKNIFLED